MKALYWVASLLGLCAVFALGVLFHHLYLQQTGLWCALKAAAGGNLVSPISILISASVASLAALFGLRANYRLHRKSITLDALGYKRFTWSGVRTCIPIMTEIDAKRKKLSEDAFSQYIRSQRKSNIEMQRYISILDSYQHIASGIHSGFYDKQVAWVKMGEQSLFLCEGSSAYIEWRKSAEVKGPADHFGHYEDLQSLCAEWQQKRRASGK